MPEIQYAKLVTPVVARWNSQYTCLEFCLKNKGVITRLLEFHDLVPNPREWDDETSSKEK